MQMVGVTEPSRLVAIASPEYLQRYPAPRIPELQRHNCLGFRKENQYLPWEFAKGKSQCEMSVAGALTVNSRDLVVRAAWDGVGIGYTIESYVARHVAAGRLVPLLVDWSSGRHSYYLYYPGRRQLPLPLKVFTACMRQQRASHSSASHGGAATAISE